MAPTKRVTAPPSGFIKDDEPIPSDWSAVDKGRFEPYLCHVTDGCSVKDLDPSACVPMFLCRQRIENAILRLMSILNGDNNEDQVEFGLTGMVSGTPTSVVVPLIGDLHYIVDEYLSLMFDDSADARAHKKTHDIWYGVIDGNHFLLSLLALRDKDPGKWESVKWKVFCVRHDLEMYEYRKLAVVQNERNKQAYHYETTLYEMLLSLRRIHDNLYAARLKVSRTGSRGVAVHHRDVAHLYDGGDHDRNTTVRQAVTVATRLSRRTINAIGEIANLSCPDIILANGDLNRHKLKSTSSVLSHYDCRLFKRFVCTSTLRGARHFMNAIKNDEEDAQVNAIFRARHWCEKNEYRPIRPSMLNEQFRFAKMALYEEAKFLVLIDEDEWPKHMETTANNLLRTTIFDDELDANKGNEADALEDLWNTFTRLYPGRAKGIKLAKEKRDAEALKLKGAGFDQTRPPQPPDVDASPENEISEEEKKKREEEKAKQKEAEEKAKRISIADGYLDESGIRTYEMSFEEFGRNVWSSPSPHVNLVFSSIPVGENDNTSKKLPQFCKSVLKTGSYVFLLVHESEYWSYNKLFTEHGFKVCDHWFTIVYDTSTMKNHKSHDFPQKHSEIALVAKTQGRHPSGFKPNFVGKYSSASEALSPSGFASILNVPQCTNKLKRPNSNAAIFPAEKSVHLFSRVIQLFSPTDGSVLDPFGGPLTSSLACLQTGRSCTSIDTVSEALSYARGRLRIFATPNATMELLETYTHSTCDAHQPDPEQSPSPLSNKKKRKTRSAKEPASTDI